MEKATKRCTPRIRRHTILRAAADEADVDLDSGFGNEGKANVDLFPDFDNEDDATDTEGEESEEGAEEEDEMRAFRQLEICYSPKHGLSPSQRERERDI